MRYLKCTVELSLLTVSKNGRTSYWNYTSDFDFDLFIVLEMAFRIGVPNLNQIVQRMAKL